MATKNTATKNAAAAKSDKAEGTKLKTAGSKLAATGKAATGKVAPAKKAAAATKPAPAKEKGAEGEATARRSQFSDSAKIKVVKADHTFREGSIRGENFARMKKSKTVGDYLNDGGASKHLGRFVEMGLVEITE